MLAVVSYKNIIRTNNNMTYKSTLLIGAATAAFAMPAMANHHSVTDGARALAKGTTKAGKGLLSGVASTGRGLLSAPGKMLKISDSALPNLSLGVQEFGLSGNIDYGDDIAYNLNLSYGYFFKDNWQIGFTTNIQGENSDLNLGLGLFTEYNFVGETKWVPFVGLSAKWASLGSDALDADSIALGLDLGVKYFLKENLALSFSVGADFAFDDVFPGGDDFQQTIKIGTRFYF